MKAKPVCFSVNVRAKELRLGAGQTVIFDDVLINEGTDMTIERECSRALWQEITCL